MNHMINAYLRNVLLMWNHLSINYAVLLYGGENNNYSSHDMGLLLL